MLGAGGGAVLLTLALVWLRPGTSAGLDWAGEQQVPTARTDYSDDTSQHSLAAQFSGNSSHTDHFKLLKEDGTSVLVGARNIIYNLSLPNLIEYTDQVSSTVKILTRSSNTWRGVREGVPTVKTHK